MTFGQQLCKTPSTPGNSASRSLAVRAAEEPRTESQQVSDLFGYVWRGLQNLVMTFSMSRPGLSLWRALNYFNRSTIYLGDHTLLTRTIDSLIASPRSWLPPHRRLSG